MEYRRISTGIVFSSTYLQPTKLKNTNFDVKNRIPQLFTKSSKYMNGQIYLISIDIDR